MHKSIIYYTDHHAPKAVLSVCLHSLFKAASGCEFVYAPSELPRGQQAIYEAIVHGLERAKGDWCFMAEQDVLYPPDCFELSDACVVFNQHRYVLSAKGCWSQPSSPLAGLSGPRKTLLRAFSSRLDKERFAWIEPNEADFGSCVAKLSSMSPYVDIRHGQNFTGGRKPKVLVDTLPYWGDVETLQKRLGLI